MKGLFTLVAITLLLALINLPIGYYTFLRIIVTIVSIIIISKEIKNGITIWVLLFGILAILFNPIFPIYLYKKNIWMPIDIIAALLFFSYGLKKTK